MIGIIVAGRTGAKRGESLKEPKRMEVLNGFCKLGPVNSVRISVGIQQNSGQNGPRATASDSITLIRFEPDALSTGCRPPAITSSR